MSALTANMQQLFTELGKLSHQVDLAEAATRGVKPQTNVAEHILEALAGAFDIDVETLERISQADRSYFAEAREKVLKSLANWDQDQQIPVCLHCGSPRVDWFETASDCGWKCQDCNCVEDAVAQGRKAA